MWELHEMDCRLAIPMLIEPKSVNCCVTSPPYFGLRDYDHPEQIGREVTPDEFVKAVVEVMRLVWDVLRDDGTLWLNLGDSYWNAKGASHGQDPKQPARRGWKRPQDGPPPYGLKPKDLIGIPWRVAFALQADGWFLRQDIIWSKPNAMPEPAKDRCVSSHEYIFLFSKSRKYHFDYEAIREPSIYAPGKTKEKERPKGYYGGKWTEKNNAGRNDSSFKAIREFRNKRSVWSIPTKPFKGAHFAAFPPDLVKPCILAGCPENGLVLDPFGGAGTTALVANALGRRAVLCELNPAYSQIIRERLA